MIGLEALAGLVPDGALLALPPDNSLPSLALVRGLIRRGVRDLRLLGVPVAFGAKQRQSDDSVTISSVIGEVAGRDVIVLDDEIARGTTVLELLERLRERDVRSVRIACTHGLFADGALQRLSAQEDVLEIVCTNTVPVPLAECTEKTRVLSVAPMLAEAIRRIHHGESVSALFVN